MIEKTILRALKSTFAAATLAVAWASLPSVTQAAPYASGVTNNAGVVQFVLNESADNVTVVFDGGASSTNLGARTRGQHSFNLDGATTFDIQVRKAAGPGYHTASGVVNTNAIFGVTNQVGTHLVISPTNYASDQAVTNLAFFSPRGVTINHNPKTPLFGRIYVANSGGGLSVSTSFAIPGGRNTGDGIYVMRADYVDPTGQGTNALTAGLNFNVTASTSSNLSSPYRIFVNPGDNRLYIGDFSDASGNVYATDANVSPGSGTNVLKALQSITGAGSAIRPVTITNTHGSCSALYLEGSTVSSNLTLWTIDEDLQTNKTSSTSTMINSLWRYDLGANAVANTNDATLIWTPGGQNGIATSAQNMGLARGANGWFYITDQRNVGSDTSGLIVVSNGIPIWNSRQTSISMFGGTIDVLRDSYNVIVSADQRFVAVSRADGRSWIIPLTNGIPDLSRRRWLDTGSSATTRGAMAFDPAGNFYFANNINEEFKAYAPGGATLARTGGDGSSTNGTFDITFAPILVAQAGSRTLGIGSNTTFTVTTDGTTPFTYQWKKDGSPITDATNSSYTIASIVGASAGAYSVVVSNIAGSVTSSNAVLSTDPRVTIPPTGLTVAPGDTADFFVTAAGTATLDFVWYQDGNPVTIAGRITTNGTATTSHLQIQNVIAGDAGNYTVGVINGNGAVTSTPPAVLTVVLAPVVTSNPTGTNIAQGGTAQLTVAAAGEQPFFYQWYRTNGNTALVDGPNIAGANSNILVISSAVKAVDEDGYYAIVTNVHNSATSTVAQVTVITPPVIALDPQSVTTNTGVTVGFSVTATGDSINYRWLKNGSTVSNGGNISGAATANLVISNSVLGNAGTYSVVLSNIANVVTSAPASLVLFEAPAITLQPRNRYTPVGSNATFRVTATGNPLYYQWAFNGAPINDATNSAYTIVAASQANLGLYSVVVSNGLGSVTSGNATLSLFNPLYWENFDADHTANWNINLSPNGSNAANIFFDFSTVGIPAGPHSADDTVRGAKLEANVLSPNPASPGGVSISPLGQSFAGDYVLKADVWQNFNGGFPAGGSGSSQYSGAGVGTAGVNPVGPDGVLDSVFFEVTGDGGINNGDYGIFANGILAAGSTNYAAAGASNRDNQNAYYTNAFPGSPAPAAQLALFPQQTGTVAAGAPAMAWHEWVIKKQGSIVTWSIDGFLMGTVDTTGLTLDGDNFMLNQWDFNNTVSGDVNHRALLFGLFDNVRVLAIDSDAPPVITQDLTNQTVNAGTIATLSIGVSSPTPVHYQWQYNNVDIVDATNSSYSISNVLKANEGSYKVRLNNASAAAFSVPATLTVNDPAINVQPTNTVVFAGGTGSLTVSAGGTGLSYLWLKEGSPVVDGNASGMTSDTLTFTSATDANAGDFVVIVNGTYGSVTSSVAALIIGDTNAPTLIVKSPKSVTGYTNSAVELIGTAADDKVVAQVLYSLNGATNIAASLQYVGVGKPTNFTATLNLTLPGSNTVDVIAIDVAGNTSAVKTVLFYYDVTAPFSFAINNPAYGTVIPLAGPGKLLPTNGASLLLGRAYKLTAVQTNNPNTVFTNWTYSTDTN
jgi:hypothetical protein